MLPIPWRETRRECMGIRRAVTHRASPGGPMRSIRLLPLFLTVALTDCTTGQILPVAFLKPSVRLHHLSVRNVGLMGGTLDLVLAFHNPNRITVRGTRLQAGLDVESNHFGDV